MRGNDPAPGVAGPRGTAEAATAGPVSAGPVSAGPVTAEPPAEWLVVGDRAHDEAIGAIESALHALTRSLKQARLREFLLAEARVDIDQAGLAVLYVLHVEGTSLRLTDLAERLRIDAPAVTRKAQQLERSGLVSRARDAEDGRASRLQLTPQGRRTINRFLAARRAWLTRLLAHWPLTEQTELARLLRQFNADVDRHLRQLDG